MVARTRAYADRSARELPKRWLFVARAGAAMDTNRTSGVSQALCARHNWLDPRVYDWNLAGHPYTRASGRMAMAPVPHDMIHKHCVRQLNHEMTESSVNRFTIHLSLHFKQEGEYYMAKKKGPQTPAAPVEYKLPHERLELTKEQYLELWEKKTRIEIETIQDYIAALPRWERYRWVLTQLTTLLCRVIESPAARRFVWRELEIDKENRVRVGNPMCAYAVSTLWQQESVQAFNDKLNLVQAYLDIHDPFDMRVEPPADWKDELPAAEGAS